MKTPAPQVPAKDFPRPAFAAPARPTAAPERKVYVPAQLGVLLELHLDKVLLEGARAIDDPDYIPEWGELRPCLPGEQIEITLRRVVPDRDTEPVRRSAR